MILFIIYFIIYCILLELSKNAIYGWIVALFIAGAFFLTRRRYKKDDAWNMKNQAIVWGIVVVLSVANYFLTEPPITPVSAVNLSNPEKTDTIKVAQGELRGVYNLDRSVEVYAGIPFAKPPVGELRWKEPQPLDSWDGLMTCDHFGPKAMQSQTMPLMDSLYRMFGYHDFEISFYDNYREPMSEDCLYLNIWKPADYSGEKLPVLFFIHGGSLTGGKTYDDRFKGENLAKKGVIVVTAAYRLNVFGYLATEELKEENANGFTGNYGLLDQIAALKWVNENIEAFGGDKDRITIAGESAGASSVNALCVSPLAKGLFTRAIAESSGIVAKYPYHTLRTAEEALAMGDAVMKEMGCSSMDEMRQLSAEQLMKTSYTNDAMMIDGYAITQEPYITYENGENNETALLNGFNAKEADPFLMEHKADRNNYTQLIEPVLGDYADEAAELVPWDKYTQTQKFMIDAGGEAKGSLNYIYSAAWFSYSHYLWSNLLAAEHVPVYEYYFTKENDSLSDYHGGEMVYAYGNLERHPGLYDSTDRELSEIMQTYWTNFVKYGDPNGEGLPEWKAFQKPGDEVLELGTDIHMTKDPFETIYPLIDMYQSDFQGNAE